MASSRDTRRDRVALRNVRLTVSYDGTRYRGFEVQPGKPTVRGVLETAIGKATGEEVRIHAGGRTDAGVHALGQVVSFFTRSSLPPSVLRLRIADELPGDVAAVDLAYAPRSFHARHSAIARRYRYQIATQKLPLIRTQTYWVRAPLDVERMREASAPLTGHHDFSAFADLEASEDPRLAVHECEVRQEDALVVVDVLAERFLWKMVRRIVGALIAVGRGELPPSVTRDAIEEPRGESSKLIRPHTVPPQGLILVRVIYPEDLKPQAAKLFPTRP